MVSPTGIIKTIVGGIAADVSASVYIYPIGITTDAAGALYVADGYYGRVLKVSTESFDRCRRRSNPPGDGLPGTSVSFATLMDAAIDATGNLYAAEWDSGRVRVILAAPRL